MKRSVNKRKDYKKNYQKRYEKKSPKKINVKHLRKVVFFLACTLMISFLVYTVVNISSTKTIDYTRINSSENYILGEENNELNKTLILLEEGYGNERKIANAYLYVKNNKKENGIIVYIPGNLYFNGLEEEFGNKIPVSSLRYAGDYLQKGRGVEYALWQLTQLLGTKFNEYIWITSEGADVLNNVYGNIYDVDESLKNIYSDNIQPSDGLLVLNSLSSKINWFSSVFKSGTLNQLDEKIYSNTSLTSVLHELKNINGAIAKNDTFVIDLSNSEYCEEQDSISGGKIKVLNTEKYDETFREYYSNSADSAVEKERARIEVYNGSEIDGIAYQLGRKIVNSGGDVVRYGNAPSAVEKTVIYVPNMKDYKNSLNLVSEILSGRFEVIEGRPSFMTTGDIVIILGRDIKFMYSF